MRIIGSLLGIVLLGVTLFIAWQALGLGKTQSLTITQPANGATITSSSVPVAISADSTTIAQLSTSNSANNKSTVIVTYLDGKEVQRGTGTNFTLINVPAGDHSIQARVYDAQGDSFNLSKESAAVSFHTTGIVGAVPNSDSAIPAATIPSNLYGAGAYNGNPAQVDAPTPTASPVPATVTQTAPQQAPDTGFGGMAGDVASQPGYTFDNPGPVVQVVGQPTASADGTVSALPVAANTAPAAIDNGFLFFAIAYIVLAIAGALTLAVFGRRRTHANTDETATPNRWIAMRDRLRERAGPPRFATIRSPRREWDI